MHRRDFLQTAGFCGVAAALMGRWTSVAAKAESPAPVRQIPKRSEVAEADTWDLSSLFPSDGAWDEAFAAWQKQIEGYAAFQGKLAESPETLAACLQFDLDVDRAGERLGTYAMLKTAEDQSEQRLSADAGPLHPGRQPRRPGRQLHPPGDSRRFRRPRWRSSSQRRRWRRTSCC